MYRNGTHRTVVPEETLERIRPLFAAVGLTRLANITGLDNIGIPVAQAIRPNAKGLAVSQGKGGDLAAALASAAMECIEVYHGEQVGGPLQYRSYEEMLGRGFRMADPWRLPASRERAFNPHQPMAWIEGQDWLQRKEGVWAPYCLVHTAYLAPQHDEGFFGSSSGLASGNHLLEAVSHAICELIERHATAALEELSGECLDARRLDLETVTDAHCRGLLDKFRRAGVCVVVDDATLDGLGLPCFRAVIFDSDPGPFRRTVVAGGYGCHLARPVALSRALTEAAQSRLTYVAGSRDDLQPEEAERAMDPALAAEMAALARGKRDFNSVPTHEFETFEEDVNFLLGRLEAAGFDRALVYDLTLAEFGIPVVRVLVPGLRGAKYAFHPLI
jgi:YcaO-like protein with predicted kinase domain